MGCGSFGLYGSPRLNTLRFEVADDVFRMPAEDYIDFGMLLQFFERICPRRVQQPILRLRVVDPNCYQRLLDQASDRVKNFSGAHAEFACDIPRALQGEIAHERSNASKNNPLCVSQQLVTQIQGRLEGPTPGGGRPMA